MKKLLLTLILITVACLTYAVGQNLTQPKTESVSVSARVVRIIDGDTIRVDIDGKMETVRIIGINTPELDDARPQVKCFAQEAKKKAEQILMLLPVTLESDSTQADRDRYGRLLRYVIFKNENFSLWMIRKGYAYEYTYQKPYKYQKEFKAAQKEAEKDNWGLWDQNACK